MPVFIEISLVVFVATLLSLVMKLLRQPLVVGYILTGILAGPLVLNLIETPETLELFSKLGITILLFIIGLHLNPQVIKEVGKAALVTGLGQIVATTIVGIGLAWMMGFSLLVSGFIAIGLTFSSTIIVLKLLADKNELDTLHGKVSIGFLLVQDIVASLILLIVSVLAQSQAGGFWENISVILLEGFGLILVLIAVSVFILPKIVEFTASNQETLFIFCIAWGMIVASLFHLVGFSIEIGALVSGVALSITSYAQEISSRLKPLRDFFIVLFFILLGSQMIVDDFKNMLVPAVVLSGYVLIGNPVIMFLLMNFLGYHKRTSFFAGLTVAQISEFSLILTALARNVGYVSQEIVSLMTVVGLITIALSSYMILFGNKLYKGLLPVITMLAVIKHKSEKEMASQNFEAMLFGHGRVGKEYLKVFRKLGLSYMVVDFDPKVINRLESKGVPCMYGDADDVEFLDEIPFKKLKLIVSTISDFETDLLLVKSLRKINSRGVIIVKTGIIEQALELYAAGASYVIMPHYLGAAYAQRMIKHKGVKVDAYVKTREQHLTYLRKRRTGEF